MHKTLKTKKVAILFERKTRSAKTKQKLDAKMPPFTNLPMMMLLLQKPKNCVRNMPKNDVAKPPNFVFPLCLKLFLVFLAKRKLNEIFMKQSPLKV